jgi:hypothetical protein
MCLFNWCVAPLIDHDLYAENLYEFFQDLKRKIERRVKNFVIWRK